MAAKADIFLDTSALFACIWSETGGGRMLLKLGEARAVQLLVSSQVLTEIENALRRKRPNLLGVLTLLFNRSGIRVVPAPTSGQPIACYLLTRCTSAGGCLDISC